MIQSRLPAIAAELAAKADQLAHIAAERIEQGAKTRVPVATGKLRNAIHVERNGDGEYIVLAGDSDVFYGHIIEHGSVNTPARPFLVPAAELVRAEIQPLGKAMLKDL